MPPPWAQQPGCRSSGASRSRELLARTKYALSFCTKYSFSCTMSAPAGQAAAWQVEVVQEAAAAARQRSSAHGVLRVHSVAPTWMVQIQKGVYFAHHRSWRGVGEAGASV